MDISALLSEGSPGVHQPSDDGVYSMINDPRGPALIVSVNKFKGDRMGERLGSEKDVMDMVALLNELHFDVQETLVDPTATEMWKGICEFAQICNQRGLERGAECIWLVLMSHGNERDEIYGSDGRTIPINDIRDLLRASKCHGMAGKPKIFIIQACRGKRRDPGHDVTDVGPNQSSIGIADDINLGDMVVYKKVADYSDMCMAYSTFENYVSWRNTRDGSWFIQDLVRAFREKAQYVPALMQSSLV